MGRHAASRMRRRFTQWGIGVAGVAAALSFGWASAPAALAGTSPSPTPCAVAQTASGALGSYASVAQTMLCNLNSLKYTIFTRYKTPTGAIVSRSTPAVLGQQSYVHATSLDGVTPELSVTLRPEGADSPAALRFIVQVVGGPSTFPVSVEAVLNAPTTLNMPRSELSYGYDALSGTSPDSFVTVFSYSLTAATSGDPVIGMGFDDHFPDQPGGVLGIGAHASPTAYPLTIIGGTWNGTPTDRTQPIGARLTFAPAPNAVTQTNLTLGKTSLTTDYSMTPHTNLLGQPEPMSPTTLTADVTAEKPTPASADTDTVAAHGVINALPNSIHLVYDKRSQDEMSVNYSAASSITQLDAGFDTVVGGVETKASLTAKDVPTALSFVKDNHQVSGVTSTGSLWAVPQPEIVFDAPNGPIGSIRADVHSGDPTAFATPPGIGAGNQGVAATITSAATNISATVFGLQHVQYLAPISANKTATPATPEIPEELHVIHAAGPFDARVYNGVGDSPTTATVAIRDLPAVLNLQIWPDAKKVHYDDDPASGPAGPTINSIYVKLYDEVSHWAPTGWASNRSIEATITGVPNTIDASLDNQKFTWDASDRIGSVHATLLGLGHPMDYIDANVVSVPAHFAIGLDPSAGLGLLPGASGPFGQIAIHGGENATQRQGISTPINQNTIYTSSWYGGGTIRRVDVRLFNLREAWVKLDASNNGEAHVKFDACPGATGGTDFTPAVNNVPSVDNSAVNAPCPLLIALPQWTYFADYPGATDGYHSELDPGAPGTPWFTGVTATVPVPPAALNVTFSKSSTGDLTKPNTTSGTGTRVGYSTYNLAAPGSTCSTDMPGYCPAPIPVTLDANKNPTNPIVVRVTSQSDTSTTIPDPEVLGKWDTVPGNAIEAITAKLSNLPQHADICFGSGVGCGPIRSYTNITKDPVIGTSTPTIISPTTVLDMTSNGTVPLRIDVDDCSATVTTSDVSLFYPSTWTDGGECDNSTAWSSNMRNFQTVHVSDLELPTNSMRLELGDQTYDATSLAPVDSVINLFLDTAGNPITIGDLVYHAIGGEHSTELKNAGIEAWSKRWYYRDWPNGILADGKMLAAHSTQLNIFIPIVGTKDVSAGLCAVPGPLLDSPCWY